MAKLTREQTRQVYKVQTILNMWKTVAANNSITVTMTDGQSPVTSVLLTDMEEGMRIIRELVD